MYREGFFTSAGPADFPGALVQLTRSKQAFVEHVDYPNQASLHTLEDASKDRLCVEFVYLVHPV